MQSASKEKGRQATCMKRRRAAAAAAALGTLGVVAGWLHGQQERSGLGVEQHSVRHDPRALHQVRQWEAPSRLQNCRISAILSPAKQASGARARAAAGVLCQSEAAATLGSPCSSAARARPPRQPTRSSCTSLMPSSVGAAGPPPSVTGSTTTASVTANTSQREGCAVACCGSGPRSRTAHTTQRMSLLPGSCGEGAQHVTAAARVGTSTVARADTTLAGLPLSTYCRTSYLPTCATHHSPPTTHHPPPTCMAASRKKGRVPSSGAGARRGYTGAERVAALLLPLPPAAVPLLTSCRSPTPRETRSSGGVEAAAEPSTSAADGSRAGSTGAGAPCAASSSTVKWGQREMLLRLAARAGQQRGVL